MLKDRLLLLCCQILESVCKGLQPTTWRYPYWCGDWLPYLLLHCWEIAAANEEWRLWAGDRGWVLRVLTMCCCCCAEVWLEVIRATYKHSKKHTLAVGTPHTARIACLLSLGVAEKDVLPTWPHVPAGSLNPCDWSTTNSSVSCFWPWLHAHP